MLRQQNVKICGCKLYCDKIQSGKVVLLYVESRRQMQIKIAFYEQTERGRLGRRPVSSHIYLSSNKQVGCCLQLPDTFHLSNFISAASINVFVMEYLCLILSAVYLSTVDQFLNIFLRNMIDFRMIE